MATKVLYFHGKVKWAQLGLGPTPEDNADKEYKSWKLNLYLSDDSWKDFEKSGLQLKRKTDDDGAYVTFRRPFSKVIKDDLTKFEAPKVTNAEGEIFKDYIGNGSDAIIKVVVFDTKKGIGHRLEEVKVIELVDYKADAQKLVVGGREFAPF